MSNSRDAAESDESELDDDAAAMHETFDADMTEIIREDAALPSDGDPPFESLFRSISCGMTEGKFEIQSETLEVQSRPPGTNEQDAITSNHNSHNSDSKLHDETWEEESEFESDVGSTETENLSPGRKLMAAVKRKDFDEAKKILKEHKAPLEKDGKRRTAAHYAAKTNKGKEFLEEVANNYPITCLKERDDCMMTPVLYAAQRYPSDTLGKLVDKILGDASTGKSNDEAALKKLLKKTGETGDTLLHFAARNRRASDFLLSMVDKESLTWKNSQQQTVLHIVAEYGSLDTLQKLVESAKDSLDNEDADGNKYFHCATRNQCENAKVVLNAIKSEHFEQPNNKQQNSLQLAIISKECKDETTHELLARNDAEIKRAMKYRDKNGNTALMYAIQHKKYETARCILEKTKGDDAFLYAMNNSRKTALHMMFEDPTFMEKMKEQVEIWKWLTKPGPKDGKGRSNDFYACLGWNFSILHDLVGKNYKGQSKSKIEKIIEPDIDGNTLLHALFMGNLHVAKAASVPPTKNLVDGFLRVFLLLTGNGIDCRKENDLGQNCLHASLIREDMLCEILQTVCAKTSTDGSVELRTKTSLDQTQLTEVRQKFRSMLLSRDGFHAIHSFVSKYDISTLTKYFVSLTNIPEASLLRFSVTKGPYKGATCLHLACEADHGDNMEYLISKGLSLDLETSSGLTCLDMAQSVRKIPAVKLAFKQQKGFTGYSPIKPDQKPMNQKEEPVALLRLIDPPARSLKLPHRVHARRMLVAVLDGSDRHEIMKLKDHRSSKYYKNLPQHEPASTLIDLRTPKVILLKALKLDSSELLRSAMKIKKLDYKVELGLLEYLYDYVNLPSENHRLNESGRTIFSNFLKANGTSTSTSSQSKSVSEMFVVDLALDLGKKNVLIDLVLTRQFELIPVCVALLIQIKQMIPNKQLKLAFDDLMEIKRKVIGITVNALDGLYSGAKNEIERNLLMKYINGDIKANEDSAISGPRFPCRSFEAQNSIKIKRYSLFQLIERANCSDLFATECLHDLTNQRWRAPTRDPLTICRQDKASNNWTPISAEIKYWIHFFAFLAFLCFFGWYLIDFHKTFQSVASEVILGLYITAFTVEEIYQIYRDSRLQAIKMYDSVLKCPVYFLDFTNIFDFSALIFMWIGAIWKWVIFNTGETHDTAYTCQMILSTSFLLWGFRSLSFLNYFSTIGLVISMIRTLIIEDLIPFALIIMVIFLSSGIFLFNLMFPVIKSVPTERDAEGYGWKVFLQVFTLPFILFLDNPPSYDTASASLNQTVGSVAHPEGYGWFKNLIVFIFLILVNIVMVNVLIALFSLRVSTMVSRAVCIWRKKYFQMMVEFSNVSVLPPPLSLIPTILEWAMFISNRIKRETKIGQRSVEDHHWWLGQSSYPEEYIRFLKFQAMQMRELRPKLFQELEQNRSDSETLKAYTGNSLSMLKREIAGALKGQEENFLRKLELRLRNAEDPINNDDEDNEEYDGED